MIDTARDAVVSVDAENTGARPDVQVNESVSVSGQDVSGCFVYFNVGGNLRCGIDLQPYSEII